ncbi:MAG: acyltransferase family protein, partial [Clostridia bacterium]|nr:acyltransferase family protein [Clostridia bacterium]
MSLLDLLIFLPVIILLILSRPTDNKSIFDRDSTSTLRGIAMIWIIINHIQGQSAFGGSPLLTYIGYWATGLFFFISGYGNTLSMNKKNADEVSVRWLLKKVKKIYIPYFVGYWLCFIIKLFFSPENIPTIKKVIIELIILDLPNMTIWFTKIILLCFLLHWIFEKVFSRIAQKYVFYSLFITLCLYIILAIKLNAGSEWYSSVICYAIGLLVAINKDKILSLSEARKKRYVY